MAARTPVKGNGHYGAQKLRRPARGHPALANFPERAGDPPLVLNRDDPATTPNVLAQGRFELDACVPVLLQFENGRYSPPPHGQLLRAEVSNLKRRTVQDIEQLANGQLRAEEWIDAHAPELKGRHRLRPDIDVAAHLARCQTSLCATLPSIGRRRNNLENSDARRYLDERLRLIDTLDRHVTYFNVVYSHFSSIYNKNLRGGADNGSEVTLGRIIQAFDVLVSPVTDNDLLDVCFHGRIDVSMIHMDRYVMCDLFDLAVALGKMRYEAFRPTREQARTALMVAGIAPDISPWAGRLGPARRALADRLYAKFCPRDLRAPLIDICHAVVLGRPVPDHLRGIRYEIIL